jgi:hypothetical protein
MITPPDHVNALPIAHASPIPIMSAAQKKRGIIADLKYRRFAMA